MRWSRVHAQYLAPVKAVARSSPARRPALHTAAFSTTAAKAKNQIFDPVRNTNSLDTYLSVSASSNTPLLTFWTASWCSTCRAVYPLVRSLIEQGTGEAEGGVNLVPVEFDAPDAQSLAMTYMITSIPTLLAFDARRGEPIRATRVTDGRSLADRQFLTDWIIREAARRHSSGGGAGGSGSSFGGLFGK
ncbi:hypothetical protein V2G26_016819 [Clonostachys chloroleuca]|uniref:Thioredoxin domain-containing protein n=1 Tax=Clonostachys chloroleuca TaxID=1926264 RepID=A0AA35MC39_9HYPO|nr:unnamed protein product [Clonostachys chloroleuca]